MFGQDPCYRGKQHHQNGPDEAYPTHSQTMTDNTQGAEHEAEQHEQRDDVSDGDLDDESNSQSVCKTLTSHATVSPFAVSISTSSESIHHMTSLKGDYHLCDNAESERNEKEEPCECNEDLKFVPEASRRSISPECDEKCEEIGECVDYHGRWQEPDEPEVGWWIIVRRSFHGLHVDCRAVFRNVAPGSFWTVE